MEIFPSTLNLSIVYNVLLTFSLDLIKFCGRQTNILNYYPHFIHVTLLTHRYVTSLTEISSQNRLPSSSMSDSPSLANLQNKQNRDQQYHAVRCQSNRNSNSNDSGSFKAEGNGMLCKHLCKRTEYWEKFHSYRHRIHRRHLSIRNVSTEQTNVQRKFIQR